MATVAEQLAKLKEKQAKIDADAEAKRAEVAAEMDKLRDAAADEAMGFVKQGFEMLSGMGHSAWEIGQKAWAQLGLQVGKAPRAAKGTGRGGKGGTRVTNTDRECPICKFKTLPYHDARRHRSQDVKKPFTAKELTEWGMTKV